MNVSRRRYMGGKGGSIPYQRIEYLESTGTQYIKALNNRAKLLGDFYFEIESQFTSVPSSSYTGNGMTSSGGQFFYALNSSNATGLYMAFNGATNVANNLSANKTDKHIVKAYTESGFVVYNFDGIDVARFTQVEFTLSFLYLFALSYVSGSLNGVKSNQRIYRSKFSANGVDVFDFVPCRIGTTGYMYDRVSGELFGNAGTGAFTLGSDIN